jgi:hypothetical protein
MFFLLFLLDDRSVSLTNGSGCGSGGGPKTLRSYGTGSVSLANGSGCGSGRPKAYGSYGPGSGFGSATLICTLLTCACLPDGHDDAAYVILLVLGGLAERFPQLQLHKVLQLRVDTPPGHHKSSPSYSFSEPLTELWISGSGSVPKCNGFATLVGSNSSCGTFLQKNRTWVTD